MYWVRRKLDELHLTLNGPNLRDEIHLPRNYRSYTGRILSVKRSDKCSRINNRGRSLTWEKSSLKETGKIMSVALSYEA